MPDDKTTPFDAQWLLLQPWQVALLLVPCRCKSPVKLVFTKPGDFPAVVCTACDYGVVDNTIEAVVLRHNRGGSLYTPEFKTQHPVHFPVDPEPLRLAVALMAQLLQQDEIQDGIDALVLQGKLPRDNQRCTHRAGPAHCAGLEKDFAELSGTLANLVLPLTPGSPWNRQAGAAKDRAVAPKVKTEKTDIVHLVEDTDPIALTRQGKIITCKTTTAANVIEWCRGRDWLAGPDLFARQIQVLVKFFEDACYFCSDVDYIHDVKATDSPDVVLSHYCLLQHGVCPKCKRNRAKMLTEWTKDPRYQRFNQWDKGVTPPVVPPNEFVGIWGQRSSKNTTTALIFTYILHRLLALPDPPKYFGLPADAVLQLSMVATTLTQAKEILLAPFISLWTASPWANKITNVSQQSAQCQLDATFVAFPDKHVVVVAMSGESAQIRGGTNVVAAINELGWYPAVSSELAKPQGLVVRDGTDAFLALENSLRTIRSAANRRRSKNKDFNAIDGYMVNISSPQHTADPIERRAGLAHKAPRMYFTRYATWEVNPREREHLLREEFKGNHESFCRDFCAQISGAVVEQALRDAKDKMCKLSREQVIVRMAHQDFSFLGEKAMVNISPADWCRLAQDRLAQLDEQERREADQRARRAKPPGVKTATVKKPTRTTVKKGVVPEPPARKSVQARMPDNAGKNDEAQAAHIPPKGTVILVPGSDDAVAAQKVAQKAKVLEEQNKAKEQDDIDPRATEALQAKLRSIARLALQRSGDILVRSQTQLIWVLYNEQGNLYEIRNILGKPHDFVLSKVKNYDCAALDSKRCPSQDMEAVLGIQTMGPDNQVVSTVWYDRVDLRPRGDAVIPGPTLASIVDSTKPAEPEKEVFNA